MPQQSAIVVVVDRLGAGFLGPYGNTWLETPEFNRLASQSFLCEQVLADSPGLETSYRSYWQGLHAMCLASAATSPLPALAAHAKLEATLLTDEPRVAEHALAASFAERIVLPSREIAAPAAEPEQTALVQLFAAACDWLSRARPPFLLWIHAQGMAGPWDAPPEFRRQFAGADDPEPPQFVTPPSLLLAEDADPDEAWGLAQAYAGQVSLVDLGLGMLLDSLEEFRIDPHAMLAVTSPRGYPLGEHGRVGTTSEALYGELLHVPLFVRLPKGAGARQRSQALVQPPDLFATLVDWLALSGDTASVTGRSLLPLISGERGTLRDRACATVGNERAIRTPAWFMRQPAERYEGRSLPQEPRHTTGQQCELFVKPDDRWEVNEVSVRCQDLVEELSAAISQFEQAAQSLPLAELPPLSHVLAEGLD